MQSEYGNHALRRITLATRAVLTLAGKIGASGYADGVGTNAQFSSPNGVTMTASGDVLLIVSGQRLLLLGAFALGVLSLYKPTVMQADWGNSVIRHLVLATASVTTLAGAAGTEGLANGVGTAAIFHRPVGVAMDALGTVAVVADTYNHLIRRITISSGAVVTLAGQGGVKGISNGLGTVATFFNPFGISFLDAAGGVAVVVSCRTSHCVQG